MTGAELPPIDHALRVRILQERLTPRLGNGCDALLFTDLTDVRWLTGFTGSNGWAVLRSDELILGTDGRYGDRAPAETAARGHRDRRAAAGPAARAAASSRCAARRVGLDPRTTTFAEWGRLAADIDLEPMDSLGQDAAQVKDDAEIARIEAAAGSRRRGARRRRAAAARHGRRPRDRGRRAQRARVPDAAARRRRPQLRDDRRHRPDHAARPHHEVGDRTIVEGTR